MVLVTRVNLPGDGVSYYPSQGAKYKADIKAQYKKERGIAASAAESQPEQPVTVPGVIPNENLLPGYAPPGSDPSSMVGQAKTAVFMVQMSGVQIEQPLHQILKPSLVI